MTDITFAYNDLSDTSLHGLARKILAGEGNITPTDEQVSEKVLWYIYWKCHQDEPPAKKRAISKPVDSKNLCS